jgi:archaellum component FlaG (FlaF/FlaG flagellin family)
MSLGPWAVMASEGEIALKTDSNLEVGVRSAEVSANSVTISNEYLTMMVYPNGNFKGENAAGEYIFYPGATSALSIKVGSKEYDVYSLSNYRTKDTFISPANDKETITEWDLPEGIHIEQHIWLEGDHAVFAVNMKNNRDYAQTVSIRYLWDTQLSNNDGSPLKAKGTLYTKEICFKPVDFDHWSAYSRPDESTAEVVTYGWWANRPDMLIFAHWPHAISTTYSYDWDPNRQFYTPGYVSSPNSDSCVLMYWEDIALPANGEKSVTSFYGTSHRVELTLSMRLDKAEYNPNETMSIYVKAIDADGHSNYPLTRDNTEVRIDGNDVNIEDIIPQPNGEYLVKVKAPSEAGEHDFWAQVVTDQGYASDSKSFSVTGEILMGTVTVSLNGNVDDATQNWDYPTKYDAPVFRRGTDNPTFIVNLNRQLPSDYTVLFEIGYYKGDESFTPIARHLPTNFPALDKVACLWQWDDDISGVCLEPNSLPIGKYIVRAYLVNKEHPLELCHFMGSEDFYVIFDFDEDIQSFVTWDKENGYGISRTETGEEVFPRPAYELQFYKEPKIWETAIQWASGAVTTREATDKISELARRIDGEMVFHHADCNERHVPGIITSAFRIDEYDNDFDGDVDEPDEAWDHNYNPSNNGIEVNKTDSIYTYIIPPRLGKAYYQKLTWQWDLPPWDHEVVWVDGVGREYDSPDHADKIAWYFDIINMLEEDFDPENRIPEPYQHSLGVCEDYAMLTVGYLRVIGVPARVVTGYPSEGQPHAWVQWVDVTGNGQWNHLDTDYSAINSDWEDNKFNPKWLGETWNHVLVRNNQNISDWSDIADQYNDRETLSRSAIASESLQDDPICNYEIIAMPIFKPGETSRIELNITNPASQDKTVTVVVELMPAQMGGSLLALTGDYKEMTVPANSEITDYFDLAVPGYAFPSDNYNLDVYEVVNDTAVLALTNATRILAKHTLTTGMPDEILYNEPFTFSVTVENTDTVPIHDVFVELDTHHYFNTTDPLRKESVALNAGESHTFAWSLTPIWYGELRIDVSVSTSDAGSQTVLVSIPVLQMAQLWLTPQVPEKVTRGEDFSLDVAVFNSGDIPSGSITLSIAMPENVTSDKTSADLGIIEARESKTCSFTISQNETEDFAILVNVASTSATAENYAFINIIQPNMFIDILTTGETPGTEQHTAVIETLADEPCSLTIYIKNTGEETLHNVQILTNVNVTESVGDIDEGEIKQVPIEFTPTTPGLSGLNVTVRSDEIERSLVRTLLVKKFDFVISIPKTEYILNEPVPINISVTNKVPNVRFIDLKIEISVSGSYEQNFEIPLLSLAPLETKDTTFIWDTTGVSRGNYTIATSLMMADQEIMTDEKHVSITAIVTSVNTSTDTGTAYFAPDAGSIENLITLNESDLPGEKPDVEFPHGLFSFNITELNLNQTVNITITLPQSIPITAQYWKYGQNGSDNNPQPERWYQIPMGSNDGDNVITITLQDGGIGDDDGVANGVIVDVGGPGIPPSPPTTTPSPTTRPPSGGGGGGGGGPSGHAAGVATVEESERPAMSDDVVLQTMEIVSANKIAMLTIPAGTRVLDALGNPLAQGISITAIDASVVPAAPSGATYTSAGYAFECGPDGAIFNPAITLSIIVPEADWGALDHEHLSIKWYNPATLAWESLPTSVDLSTRTVSAQVTHFSIFALFVDTAIIVLPTTAIVTTATTTVAPPPAFPTLPVAIAVIVIIIVIIAAYLYLQRKKQ